MIFLVLSCSCRFAVFVVFGWAAVSKVKNRASYRAFSESLSSFPLLPAKASWWLAPVAIVAEAAAAGLAISPWTPLGGTWVASVLSLFFTLLVLHALHRKKVAVCLCFGQRQRVRSLGWRHVVRNGLLFGVSLCGTLAQPFSGSSPDVEVIVLALVVGLVVGSLFIVFDDLVDLFASASSFEHDPKSVR